MRDRLAEMVRLWADLRRASASTGIESPREPDLGFVWATHRWAIGGALDTVLRETDMQAGDFVRWTKQVIDLLGQVADAAAAGETAAGPGTGNGRSPGRRAAAPRCGRVLLGDLRGSGSGSGSGQSQRRRGREDPRRVSPFGGGRLPKTDSSCFSPFRTLRLPFSPDESVDGARPTATSGFGVFASSAPTVTVSCRVDRRRRSAPG